MSPLKLLSIWVNYWGKLTPKWREEFLKDSRVKLILEYPDLLILQAIQKNKKLEDVLAHLEKSSKKETLKSETDEFEISRARFDKRNELGTEVEVNQIRQWLEEFSASKPKLSQEEVVNWTTAKTDMDTCKAKKKYASEKEAILAVIRLGKSRGEVIKQLPYKCNVCRDFHNSHLLSWESIERLQRKYS